MRPVKDEVCPYGSDCFTCRLPDCRCAGSCASRYNRLPGERTKSDAARKAYRKKMNEQEAAKVLRDYLENREMPAVVYAAICLAVDRLEGGRSRSVMEYREGRV